MFRIISPVFLVILIVGISVYVSSEPKEELPKEITTPTEEQVVVESTIASSSSDAPPVVSDEGAIEVETTPTPQPAIPEVSRPEEIVPSGYTKAEVAIHKDATSCWSIINGMVYDLTSWIGKHPGGERAILKICGRDGTSLFEGEHGGDAKPESALSSFLLGPLSE